jgi:predicted O-methyltransferase YrrM
MKHRLKFYLTLLRRKPYFGPVYRANQVWPERKPYMSSLLGAELCKHPGQDFKILEVGSWAGSSAILWASQCKARQKGLVFCVDTWRGATHYPPDMREALLKDRIYHLFCHNIKYSEVSEYIVPMRTSSDHAAEILKEASFDFVYIDGDHAYTQFTRDIRSFLRVVKDQGLICGDDLELLYNEVDLEYARKHRENDAILDPKTNKYFHPGVTLGVHEVFGEVSCFRGFWAMRKTGQGWEKVDISGP